MEGGSQYSAQLAEYYHGILNGFPGEIQLACTGPLDRTREFVVRFFHKEPALRRRFEAWIASFHE